MTPKLPTRRRRRRLWPKLFLPRMLKRRAPSSFFGRSLLIIVLPICIMQIAVTWAFFDAHWRTVTSRLSEGLAGDVAWVVDSYKTDPGSLGRLAERAEQSLDLSIVYQPGRELPTRRRFSLFQPIDQSMEQA